MKRILASIKWSVLIAGLVSVTLYFLADSNQLSPAVAPYVKAHGLYMGQILLTCSLAAGWLQKALRTGVPVTSFYGTAAGFVLLFGVVIAHYLGPLVGLTVSPFITGIVDLQALGLFACGEYIYYLAFSRIPETA
jgi:uncharacterized membrane protein (DUF441 family)